MARKIFKPKESSYYPKWEVSVNDNGVHVTLFDWEGDEAMVGLWGHDDLGNLDLFLSDQGSSFHASQVLDWVKSHPVHKKNHVRDPFTSYTFNY